MSKELLTELNEHLLLLADDLAKLAEQNTPAKEEAKPAATDTPAEPAVTLEEVRTVLSELSKAGKRDEVKALLEKHGVKKLSDVKPEEYGTLKKEAEELSHA